MTVFRASAAAFALLTTACGSVSLSEAALLAADRWHRACGVRPEPESLTILDSRTVPCGDSTNAAGCTHRQRDVTVAARASVGLEDVLLHEFGHVLGAGHHTGRGVLRSSLGSDQWTPCLTPDDLDEAACPDPRPECP